MSYLVDFYKKRYITNFFEGYSQQVKGQVDFLRNIVNDKSINNVMEIGFNAGHSAELFLYSNKNINLVSFDIGYYGYVNLGKEFIIPSLYNFGLVASLIITVIFIAIYAYLFASSSRKISNALSMRYVKYFR